MSYKAPKGVFDILPGASLSPSSEHWRRSEIWQHVESTIRTHCQIFGYQEIRTPIFEKTELFQRGVGDTTDIVQKEMYTFEDRAKRLMTLRPEGTAPAMRAYLEAGLAQESPIQRFFYIGPMFRYERPQAGRYRQHHQFGVEAIGVGAPEQDAEVIILLYTLLARLGIQNLQVKLNSIGSAESRSAFRKKLQDHLRPHLNSLSEDSQRRFDTNPLRILDSKDPNDIELTRNAPVILDCLDDDSKSQFESVKRLLTMAGVDFVEDPLLVRGLDYYNGTVFEIVASELGAQNSVGGGGRYDGLIKTLGGPEIPAIGFGSGMERIIHTMIGQNAKLPPVAGPAIFLIPIGEAANAVCFEQLVALRESGVSAAMDYSGRKLKKVMSYANQLNARYVSIIGDEEINKGSIRLKEMESGLETEVELNQLTEQMCKTISAERKELHR